MLNVPDNYYQSAEQFWNDYNKVFLDEAIKRGDDIVLVTNPLEIGRVFKDLEDIPPITNINSLSKQLLSENVNNLSGFGKELKYLFENGYSYDVSKNVFIK